MSIEAIFTRIADAMEKQTEALGKQTEAIDKLTAIVGSLGFSKSENTTAVTVKTESKPVKIEPLELINAINAESAKAFAAPIEQQATDSEQISKEQLRSIIEEFTAKHSDARQQLRGMMMSMFKVSKLPDIKESDYTRFYHEIKMSMEA